MNASLASITLAAAITCWGAGCAAQKTASPGCRGSCACVVPAGEATAVNAATAEALRETLQDERRAQVFYTQVMARHGRVAPFVNIIHAEERHEAVITSLMKRHDVAVPPAGTPNVPAVPDSLAECNRAAAQLERENIEMYDRLLAGITEPDIRAAFENLRAASLNNHLPAFERRASANAAPAAGMMGMGYGRGRGAGRACGYGYGHGPCPATP